jgi:hypothetical protein
MDPTIKHWLGLWDYLDHNFWAFWQWATAHLRPEDCLILAPRERHRQGTGVALS